jgi:4-diphosphocytidyl-2-C-methyl-D-erythritol kinase
VTAIRVHAHAKVNLDLRVLRVRADGFHELRTVFQSISLHDTLTAVPRPGPFAIECDTDGVPRGRTNLVWRAADRLWRMLRRRGSPRDVAIRLQKRIPLEAGLGGGSADAAAALVALSRLWQTGLRPQQLADLAATLGADVPFFLTGGTALGLGRGDEIYPLGDLDPYWMVMLCPRFGVSSADAYAWYDAELQRGALVRRSPRPQSLTGPWSSQAAWVVNDLEAPVARQHPVIARARAALRRAGAEVASMSGSGSTVFGLFRRRSEAEAAMGRLAGSWETVLLAQTLGRAGYGRRLSPRAVRASLRD